MSNPTILITASCGHVEPLIASLDDAYDRGRAERAIARPCTQCHLFSCKVITALQHYAERLPEATAGQMDAEHARRAAAEMLDDLAHRLFAGETID